MVKSNLLDQVRQVIGVKHFSMRTEQAYVYWFRKFFLFKGSTTTPKKGGLNCDPKRVEIMNCYLTQRRCLRP